MIKNHQALLKVKTLVDSATLQPFFPPLFYTDKGYSKIMLILLCSLGVIQGILPGDSHNLQTCLGRR